MAPGGARPSVGAGAGGRFVTRLTGAGLILPLAQIGAQRGGLTFQPDFARCFWSGRLPGGDGRGRFIRIHGSLIRTGYRRQF